MFKRISVIFHIAFKSKIFLIENPLAIQVMKITRAPYIKRIIAMSYHYKILILTAFAIQEKMYRLGRCYAQQRFSLPIRQPEGKRPHRGPKTPCI